MRFVIGLDAGSTKTSVVVLDEQRVERGRGLGGPANYHSAGQEGALGAIRTAIAEALAAAHLQPTDVGAACFALSGVDRPADRVVAESFARAVLPGVPTVLCNDAIAALYSGAG